MDMNGSRRSFLKGSAVAGTAYIVGSPALAASIRSSVIVVGAGAFGGWSALQFAQRGGRTGHYGAAADRTNATHDRPCRAGLEAGGRRVPRLYRFSTFLSIA